MDVYRCVVKKSTQVTSGSKKDKRYWKRKRRREKKKKLRYKTFEEVFTFENLYEAGIKSCRNVRWKSSTITFESYLKAFLIAFTKPS